MIPVYRILLDTASISAIVGDRVYDDGIYDDLRPPYIKWSDLVVVPDNHLSGPPVSDRHSIMIDAFGVGKGQAKELIELCQAALEAHGPNGPRGVVTSGPQSLGQDVQSKIWRYTFTVDIFRNR